MVARRVRHVPAPNNWYLFPFTVAGFLRACPTVCFSPPGSRSSPAMSSRGAAPMG